MDDNRDIDKIFTEGFSEEQFPYNPASWDAMSGMLDEEDKRDRWWIWLRWSLLLLVTIGSGVALVVSLTGDEVVAEPSVGAVVESTEQGIGELVDTDAERGATKLVAETTEVSGNVQTVNTAPINIEQSASRDMSETIPSSSTTTLSTARTNNNKDDVSDSTASRLVAQSMATMMMPAAESRTDSNVSAAGINERSDEQLLADTDRQIDVDQLPLLTAMVEGDIDDMEVPAYAILPEVAPQARTRRWEVELTGGAELSVLGSESSPKLGSRGGLRLGYYLSSQWSVHTGLVYSNKLFAGSGDAFEDRSIFTDAAPEKMEGKSAFVEIPISVRYHWSSAKRMGHFVEAGFTNFNHRSEWYGFEYRPEDEAPNLMKEIPSRSVNKMALGAFRLAYGLDIGLGATTSVGIVPYIQVPLRGIGAGNVSIYNTGLELALRHRL